MEHYLEISASDCFIGLVNAKAYQSFIGGEVDYETLEKRVVQQMQQGHLLFWGSQTPNRWTLRLVDQAQAPSSIQEFKGRLLVSEEGVHVINYPLLMDAAEFEEDALIEQPLEGIALAKGWYEVTVRQLFDLEQEQLNEESLGFEIVFQALPKTPTSPANSLEAIPWSIY